MKNNKYIIMNLWRQSIFYKQFDKLFYLISNINCLNQNFIKSQINNIFAFSLIELSIVLIIIGLLVAGITGGASLIESAKVKAFYDSLNQYKQAVYTFYSTHDRLPGDFNLDGKIGYLSGEAIKKEYFKPPYDGTDTTNTYYLPNEVSAPFVELYQNKLINWEPTGGEVLSSAISNVKGVNNGVYCYFHTLRSDRVPDSASHYFYGMKENTIFLQCQDNSGKSFANNSSKFGYSVDKKYDDGMYNNANFRAVCCGGNGIDWSLAIRGNCSCKYFSYIIWENL